MAQQESEIPRLHPEKIGNYRIVRLIGEGGMGRVYEAIHEQIQRRAAIKVLHAQFAHNSEAFTRFLNEARAVNIVQHPGVVNVFEFGQTEDGSPYIVMEYLEGESLSARLERLKFMSLGALRIARQLASALVAAHSKHIIHRDLKPSQIPSVNKASSGFPEPSTKPGKRSADRAYARSRSGLASACRAGSGYRLGCSSVSCRYTPDRSISAS